LNPDDIKGSDTFAQVSALSGIAKAEFLARFKISEEDFDKGIFTSRHLLWHDEACLKTRS
jgi:hypothetical protein